jgi:hypothetical protein
MIVPHFSPLVEISNLKFRIFPPKFNFPAKIQNSNFPAKIQFSRQNSKFKFSRQNSKFKFSRQNSIFPPKFKIQIFPPKFKIQIFPPKSKIQIFPPKFNFPAACIPLTSCPHLTLSCYMLGICIAEDKIDLVLDENKIIDCKPSHMGIEHLQNRRGVLCYSLTSRMESNRGTEQSMCIIPASHFVIQLLACPCVVLLAGFSL